MDDQDNNGQLAGLVAQANAIDGEVAASAPEAVQAAQEHAAALSMAEQNAGAVAGMLEMALPLICPMYPSLEAIYTPDVCARVAGTMGPLLAKYGIDMGDMGGRYREEIAAFFVCGPVAVATYKGIMADIAARAGAPRAVEHQPAAQVAGTAATGLKPGDYGYVEAQERAGA